MLWASPTWSKLLSDEIDVEREGCGFCVPVEDPEALARAMNRIFADPDHARAMSAASRRLAIEHYNIDRFATQLDAFFTTL